jgi:oligogalacturonide lyase
MNNYKRSFMPLSRCRLFVIILLGMVASGQAQIGKRFPVEKKVIKDPVTGVTLTFLTSRSGMGDQKIYQTHPQWTADGAWIVFRSDRVRVKRWQSMKSRVKSFK